MCSTAAKDCFWIDLFHIYIQPIAIETTVSLVVFSADERTEDRSRVDESICKGGRTERRNHKADFDHTQWRRSLDCCFFISNDLCVQHRVVWTVSSFKCTELSGILCCSCFIFVLWCLTCVDLFPS